MSFELGVNLAKNMALDSLEAPFGKVVCKAEWVEFPLEEVVLGMVLSMLEEDNGLEGMLEEFVEKSKAWLVLSSSVHTV